MFSKYRSNPLERCMPIEKNSWNVETKVQTNKKKCHLLIVHGIQSGIGSLDGVSVSLLDVSIVNLQVVLVCVNIVQDLFNGVFQSSHIILIVASRGHKRFPSLQISVEKNIENQLHFQNLENAGLKFESSAFAFDFNPSEA